MGESLLVGSVIGNWLLECAAVFFSVSVVFLLFRVMSRRDDGVGVGFACKLVREAKATDTTSETKSNHEQKGFPRFW